MTLDPRLTDPSLPAIGFSACSEIAMNDGTAFKSWFQFQLAALQLGRAVAAASLAPLALLTAPLGLAVAAAAAAGGKREGEGEGGVEEAVIQGAKAMAGFTWGVHNALWAPVFGSGANNNDGTKSKE